jgi:putative tricarboxylic transport membrane protein
MYYLITGVVIGLSFGFIPGLSGITVLVLLMPFALTMEPVAALALILGAHAVVVTGDTITAVLFNIPGTTQSIATCFDGFPLAQKGRAAEAIAAGLTSSMIGGIIGAVLLLAAVPVFKPLAMALGSAEYFVLILFGITLIALLGGKSFLKGLISGGLGLLFSLIGFDLVTGGLRYTFGISYLYGGLSLFPVMIGLFAIAQMMTFVIEGNPITERKGKLEGFRGIIKGIYATFLHLKACIRGSFLGALVGMIPGIGGTVANLLAYGLQVSTAADRSEYGKGKIEGVIAAESANNAKEGGALIPTLAFGLPGSAAMAVLMSLMIYKGIVPGPNMVTDDIHITLSFVLILITANILAATLAIIITPVLEKITVLSIHRLAPVIFVLCMLGAYSVNGRVSDVIIAIVFGVIGYFMKAYNYSPSAFIIGLLLGNRMERVLHVSIRAWGPFFIFQRPIALALLVLIVFLALFPYLKKLTLKKV